MRVAQLLPTIRLGGVSVFVRALTDALHNLGVEVDVFFGTCDPSFTFDARPFTKARLQDYDVIHHHSGMFPGLKSRLLKTTRPTLNHLHGDGRGWLSSPAAIKFSRRPNSYQVTVYKTVQKKLKDHGHSCRWIPNGIDVTLYPFHPILGPAVITFAREDSIKRWDVVAEAYRMLQARGWPSRLLIAGLGEPPETPEVYNGFPIVIGRSAQELLQDARVCVVLGRPLNEGVGAPLILWEAMASGCRIVAAKGSLQERFSDATFQFGDAVSLTQAIGKAYNAVSIGNSQRRQYVERYRDARTIAREHVKLYTEMIESAA